jgi:hypothetical protein
MSPLPGVPLKIPVDELNVHHGGLFPIEKTNVAPASLTTGMNPGSYW